MDGTPLGRLCAYRGGVAPADLGLHPADLHVIGGGAVPGAHLPAAPGSEPLVYEIRNAAHHLGRDAFAELRAFARSLAPGPDSGHPVPGPLPPLVPVTVGGIVQRLLRVRNMALRLAVAESGLAASTIRRLSHEGLVPAAHVTSDSAVGYIADALGLRRGDLLAITGRPPGPERPGDPDWRPHRMVGLLWDLAPLPVEALRRVEAAL